VFEEEVSPGVGSESGLLLVAGEQHNTPPSKEGVAIDERDRRKRGSVVGRTKAAKYTSPCSKKRPMSAMIVGKNEGLWSGAHTEQAHSSNALHRVQAKGYRLRPSVRRKNESGFCCVRTTTKGSATHVTRKKE
jgi:hypothetical protein